MIKKQKMSKIKILILAANPTNTGRIRADEEVKKIEEGIKKSKFRESIEIKVKWAITIEDLSNALLEEKPDILHFTGHGAGNNSNEYISGNRDINLNFENKTNKGCLIIETNDGTSRFLEPEKVADLISMYKNNIKCIVLNACHSQYQAELFVQNINYAIGMKKAILDKSAIVFSVAFYEAIANGENIPFAFDYSIKNLNINNLDGIEIPKLNIKLGHIEHKSLLSSDNLNNDKNNFKDIINNSIESGKIEKAITETITFLNNKVESSTINNFRMLLNRINRINNDKNNDLVPNDEYRREIAKITNAFLSFFNDLTIF